MKILFYDTETTGLPVWDRPSDDACQPRVTQLHAELVDSETRDVIACISTYIQPNGWTIPAELEKLIGITTQKCREVGVMMGDVMPAFLHLWSVSAVRVGHNESFDMRMIRIEIFNVMGDEPLADQWKAGSAQCTQAMSKGIVALPATSAMHATGRHGPKPPRLSEAYKFFTGKELENAHNAAVDVLACKTVYFAIMDQQRKAVA